MATPLKGDAHPINQNGWPDAYPTPSTTTFDQLEPSVLASWIQGQADGAGSKVPGVDYIVVDVRRADCESLIPGAINLPAHSFYQSLPSLLPLLSRVPILVFHCGNKNTRGTRCAGWLADELKRSGKYADGEQQEDGKVKIYVLKGGYNGWEREYGVEEIETRGKWPVDKGTVKAVPL
ncbi:unnamed protein product [Tilletia controversa]|nr:unnamed protein product [Tilletia controversa]CAD6911838.1 unnamed protein product [Tilletia controversa]CAD6962979.1 unnamed protein product [Tilletia controversa]CAD6984300.1 unnamed protein product [Tilletia controversa]